MFSSLGLYLREVECLHDDGSMWRGEELSVGEGIWRDSLTIRLFHSLHIDPHGQDSPSSDYGFFMFVFMACLFVDGGVVSSLRVH